MAWISVRNWRRFQHYDPAKRRPNWIKTYTELLDDDAYRDLTAGERAVLHGIWLAYASSRSRLKFDARSLSRRLGLRVTSAQLVSLSHAGYIDIVASKALADGYQSASPEVEVEVEEEKKEPSVTPPSGLDPPDGWTEEENGLADFDFNNVLRDMPAA